MDPPDEIIVEQPKIPLNLRPSKKSKERGRYGKNARGFLQKLNFMAMYLGGAAIVEADRLNDEIHKTEEDKKEDEPKQPIEEVKE